MNIMANSNEELSAHNYYVYDFGFANGDIVLLLVENQNVLQMAEK